MKKALVLACTIPIVITGTLSCRSGKYTNTENRESLQNPVTSSPLVKDYKTQTEEFLARLKKTGKLGEIQAWAKQLLQTHADDKVTFTVPHKELPDFILKLDPPLEPSMVVVFPKSNVTIAWGGGFGWWGLFLSDNDSASDNPVVYVIKWVPGVEVFHDIQ